MLVPVCACVCVCRCVLIIMSTMRVAKVLAALWVLDEMEEEGEVGREVGGAAAAKCAPSAKVEYPLGTLHLPHIHSFSWEGSSRVPESRQN